MKFDDRQDLEKMDLNFDVCLGCSHALGQSSFLKIAQSSDYVFLGPCKNIVSKVCKNLPQKAADNFVPTRVLIGVCKSCHSETSVRDFGSENVIPFLASSKNSLVNEGPADSFVGYIENQMNSRIGIFHPLRRANVEVWCSELDSSLKTEFAYRISSSTRNQDKPVTIPYLA